MTRKRDDDEEDFILSLWLMVIVDSLSNIELPDIDFGDFSG